MAHNPFEHNVWEGQRRLRPDDDVESLNHAASERILQQTEAVQRDHRARCLLLLGQPGIGKSHVLARAFEQAINTAFPVVVRRYALPQATYRNLLRQIVWGLHETRINEHWSLLDDLCFTPLQRIVATRTAARGLDLDPEVLGQATAQDAHGALRNQLRAPLLTEAAAHFASLLHETTGSDTPLPLYSNDAVRAAFLLFDPDTRPAARDWLLGQDLCEEDLERLGLVRAVEDERTAQDVLTTLALFARASRPLLVCFDQTERLESTPEESGIDALGRAIAFLRELPSISVVFSCLKDKWFTVYARELATSYLDRIAGPQGSVIELAYPSPEEALALVRRRLGGTIAPFVSSNLMQWVDRYEPTTRRLLQECAQAYARWQRDGASGTIELELEVPLGVSALYAGASATGGDAAAHRGEDGPGSSPRSSRVRRRWEATLARTADPVPFDPAALAATMALVFTDVPLQVRGRALSLAPIGNRQRDLQLVVRAGARAIGFVFDHTNNGRSFTARLKRLRKLLEDGTCDRLVLWRAGELPRGWRVGRRLCDELTREGRVHAAVPSAETLRRLEAFRTLCSEVQSEGLDHREPAAQLFEHVLAEQPEIAELLSILGVERHSTDAEATRPRQRASRDTLPTERAPHRSPAATARGGSLRDVVRALVQRERVLAEGKLRELVREQTRREVAEPELIEVARDLEREGVLWCFASREDGHVLASR
ncbi:MAG: hypothetical protein D6776_11175 [Planctomycetota bacterium]|nr:MAG: hypothetical protein D6776_11175 [Planctomycetota bacterium]